MLRRGVGRTQQQQNSSISSHLTATDWPRFGGENSNNKTQVSQAIRLPLTDQDVGGKTEQQQNSSSNNKTQVATAIRRRLTDQDVGGERSNNKTQVSQAIRRQLTDQDVGGENTATTKLK